MMALILFLIGLILRNNRDVGSSGRVVGKILFWIGLSLIIIYVLIVIGLIVAAGCAVVAAAGV